MEGDLLPDDDHVSRYCKPSDFDQAASQPKTGAFQRRSRRSDAGALTREQYLSVNWLEFFGAAERDAAVGYVREAFQAKEYRLRPNGRFLVINAGVARLAALEADGTEISFTHMPLPDDASHSAVLGLPNDDLDVAVELKLLGDRRRHLPGDCLATDAVRMSGGVRSGGDA